MENWPDDYFLRGNFAPWPMEGEVHDLVVEGELPPELRGTLLRIGPNPQYPPRGTYDWFSGDGMVHAFHLGGGRASYRNRWVRTPRFQLERAAGRALIGGLRSMADTDPAAMETLAAGFATDGLLAALNAANTNLINYDGRLLALVESSLPTEIAVQDLSTVGSYDFSGTLTSSMTAHPRVDPTDGSLHFFSYGPVEPYLRYHVAGSRGDLRTTVEVALTVPVMLHDFAVTAAHVVFMCCPATLRAEHLLSGMPVRWEPALGTRVAILRRDDPAAPPHWFTLDAGYVFHFVNAFTEGDRLTLDGVRYDRLPLFDIPGPFNGIDTTPARLTRWTFDLETGRATEDRLDDLSIEFPRIDERRACRRHRHIYAAARQAPAGGEGFYNAIVHYDLSGEARSIAALGANRFTSEPVFVPSGADEGDGLLLVVVYSAEENRSELLVLDAADVAKPPLAVVRLPHRVPYGFHGLWWPS